MMLNRWSLKARFVALLGTGVVSSALVLAFVSARLSDFEASFGEFVGAGVAAQRATLQVSRDVNYVSRLTRNIMLGDDLEKNLEALDKRRAAIDGSFGELDAAVALITGATRKASLATMVGVARNDTIAFVDDGIARMRALRGVEATPERLAAAYEAYRKNATPVANRARESFQALDEAVATFVAGASDSTTGTLSSLHTVVPALIGAGLVVTLLIGVAVMVSILRGLHDMASIAERVAGGDLSTPVQARGSDEVSRVIAAMGAMQSSLRDMVRGIQTASDSVEQGARGFANAADSVTGRLSQQNQATAAMAASVQQMTASIEHVSSSAQSARELAEDARGQADAGQEVVDQAVREIQGIAESVMKASGLIRTLDERSEEISKIVEVIKEIADQTNLLALNAAIEAARAGEQGRGFAVVADEVRKLAERTAQSTKEISTMLGAVQNATQEVVRQMDDSTSRVGRGAEMAESVRTSIVRIGEGAGRVQASVAEIDGTLQEQGEASHAISKSVERVAGLSDRNTGELREISNTAGRLIALAGELEAAVSSFRT